MKLLKRLLLLLVFFSFISLVVSMLMMVESEPVVSDSGPLTAEDLSQARIFIDNVDPRDLAPGTVSAFSIDARDIELFLSYALSQWHGGGAQVSLSEGLAEIVLSARLPGNPLGDFLNVQMTVSQWGQNLAVEELRIGAVQIPGWMVDPIAQLAHSRLQSIPEYVATQDAINGYSITPGQLNIVYQWRPELVQSISSRGRNLLVSEADQQRLLSHASNLASITNDPGMASSVPLTEVLAPALLFARVRGNDPVAENRAAILTLAMYVMGVSLPRALGLPEDSVPAMGKRRLFLSGRHDFAQHFLVSAALTVSAGTGIADTIGLLKELDDSNGGSGFSFTDLGADRAGVRFAELAVADAQSARAVQDQIAFGMDETEFMPEFRDLPESMDADTFRRDYGGIGAPAYNAVVMDIEQRIADTPFYRELNP